ncbi:MAG: DsbA family protein [Patescibacteria group bacterium]|nr:DsbA family protein [Patescibacteria group bacterium]
MEDKKTILILSAILIGTIVLITAFAFLASSPAKPVNVEIGNAYYTGLQNAKVTVVEFSDFQCPVCEDFNQTVFPRLLSAYKDKVKFVYKFFPLYEIHNLANISAQSAYCAGKQGKFWEYANLLMDNSAQWEADQSQLVNYAKQTGLDLEKFKACQNSDEAKNAVMKDRSQGEGLGVNATPTFFVNGEKIVGLQSLDYWKKLLDSKLKQ